MNIHFIIDSVYSRLFISEVKKRFPNDNNIFYTLKDPIIGQIIYIVLFIIVVWFVFHTTIISDKNPQFAKRLKKKFLKK